MVPEGSAALPGVRRDLNGGDSQTVDAATTVSIMGSYLVQSAIAHEDVDNRDSEVSMLGPDEPRELWTWAAHPDFTIGRVRRTANVVTEWTVTAQGSLSLPCILDCVPVAGGFPITNSDAVVCPKGARGFTLVRGHTDEIVITETSTAKIGLGAVPGREILECNLDTLDEIRQWCVDRLDASQTARVEVDSAELREMVERLLLQGHPKREGQATAELVEQALFFINDHEPTSAEAVWEALGVSRSTLYKAFSDVLEISPSRWMTIKRLNRARVDILRNLTPVAEAAQGQGFHHAGNFARYYRELFGERPRTTFEMARVRAGTNGRQPNRL